MPNDDDDNDNDVASHHEWKWFFSSDKLSPLTTTLKDRGHKT